MTDHEIQIILEKSQEEGFKALFEQYKNYVYTIVWNKIRKIGTTEDAEECVSDIFAHIFLHYKEINEGSFKAYIGTVAKRMAINYYRKLTSDNKYNSDEQEKLYSLSSDEDVAKNTETTDINRILFEKIQTLGEPDATIVIHKFYYKRKSNEIAKQVKLTPVSVRVHLNRALKKLRKMLENENINLEV